MQPTTAAALVFLLALLFVAFLRANGWRIAFALDDAPRAAWRSAPRSTDDEEQLPEIDRTEDRSSRTVALLAAVSVTAAVRLLLLLTLHR